jgi:hypothetical protein
MQNVPSQSLKNSWEYQYDDPIERTLGSLNQFSGRTFGFQAPVEIREKRMRILRTWLLFIILCFILELSALEIPSISMMNRQTQIVVGLMVAIVAINIVLMIYAFKKDINAVYFISLTTQISFILCNLKTSHHEGQSPNHMVVR